MFRRGFKAWSEETSTNIRKELGLPAHAPIDPLKAATHLNVPVLTPAQLEGLAPACARRLTLDHRDEWSAITVTGGGSALVIVNPAHAATRRNSSLAHELAHIILGHEPSQLFMAPASGAVLRTHNRDQEDEAGWLAGAMLLPRAALLHVRRQRFTNEQACEHYHVSPAMFQYRLNATGVDLQRKRARRERNAG
jgi:hypothetical protein